MLRSEIDVVAETAAGVILRIAFEGKYHGGSAGNAVAEEMRKVTSSAIEDHQPAAVIFDLLDLDYWYGNGICQIAMPLRLPDGGCLPARIVAQGVTARALTPLTGKHWLLGVAGITICDDIESAIAELTQQLAADGR